MYKFDMFYKNCPQFGIGNMKKQEDCHFYETPCRY